MEKPIFLFDMSGVLLDTDLDAIKAKVSQAANLPLKQINTFWKNEEYAKSERGEISSKAYFDYYAKTIKLDWSYDRWIAEWSNIFNYNTNGFGLFNYLIENHFDVYILSNLAEYHKLAVERKLDGFWNLSKANFLSYEMGLLKPDPLIYKRVCQQLAKPPEHCFYVDDDAENVASAAKLGIHSFQFLDHNIETVLEWIKKTKVNGLQHPELMLQK